MSLGLGLSNSKAEYVSEDGYSSSYSWDMDGNDEYVNCGNSSDIKLTATDTSEGDGISIHAWVKKDDWNTTSASTIFCCFQNDGGWCLKYSNRLYFDIQTVDNTSANKLTCRSNYKPFESVTDAYYRASGWVHFVGTFDGRYAKLYINGALATAGDSIGTVDAGSNDNVIAYKTDPVNRNSDVLIGADPGNLQTSDGGLSYPSGTSLALDHWTGLINEAAIWNKALDADAVEAIFDAVDVDGAVLDLTEDSGSYDYSQDLVGLWRGNEGSGVVATDEIGSNNGVLHGGVQFTSTTPS